LDKWITVTPLDPNLTAPLFPTLRHGKLTRLPLAQANVHHMIQRRAIASYLQNGKLEVAQQMAGHESARTTGLYDRRNDSVALDEIERIAY
jgi:integrase/recombinase XerD